MQDKKKTFWAGLVGGQIGFFANDPTGNVEGLEGSRKFHVENNNLTDDNGASIISNTTTGGGAQSGDVTQKQPSSQAQQA